MSALAEVLAQMNEVVAFLDGSGTLDGRGFGCRTPLIDGVFRPYWWRKPLDERWTALTRLLAEQGGDGSALDFIETTEFRLLLDPEGEDYLPLHDLIGTSPPARVTLLAGTREHPIALAARTATAPAEQAFPVEVDDAWQVIEDYLAGRFVAGEPEHVARKTVREYLRAARLAPIAPDARSVDDDALQDAMDDFEHEFLTDGNGYAPADTYRACNDALRREWPKGREVAWTAAKAEFDRLHPARPTPTPLARSVDGLTDREREALDELERDISRDECISFSDASTICAALRRLAGAKVQDKENDNG